MSGAEESTVAGGVARVQACITDCSILNQTSCQAVTRRQLVTTGDQVSTTCRVTPGSAKCDYNEILFESSGTSDPFRRLRL